MFRQRALGTRALPHPDRMMSAGGCHRMLRPPTENKEEPMTQDPLEEMGPVDYIVLEWPGRQPQGDVAPMLLDPVGRGVIRILDIALMVKGDDGSVAAVDLGEVNGGGGGFAEFDGASSGLLSQE